MACDVCVRRTIEMSIESLWMHRVFCPASLQTTWTISWTYTSRRIVRLQSLYVDTRVGQQVQSASIKPKTNLAAHSPIPWKVSRQYLPPHLRQKVSHSEKSPKMASVDLRGNIILVTFVCIVGPKYWDCILSSYILLVFMAVTVFQ